MKESFILYKSFYNPIKDLSSDQKGEILDAIFCYQLTGEIPEMSPVCKMAFSFIKAQFDRDDEKYQAIVERNKNNGGKGGRPRKQDEQELSGKNDNPQEPKKPSGLSGNPQEPKKADNDNDTVYGSDDDSDSGNDTEETPPTPSKGDSRADIDYQKFVDLYHDYCPKLPRVTTLGDLRKKLINARVKEHGKQKVVEVLERAGKSKFLSGENNRDWQANLDWLLRPSNFVKVLDGNYDSKDKKFRNDSVSEYDNQL